MKKTYIGTKIVQGEPMQEHKFALSTGKVTSGSDTIEINSEGQSREGYKVYYPDGYVSWSPKATFEACNREITAKEADLVCSIDEKQG